MVSIDLWLAKSGRLLDKLTDRFTSYRLILYILIIYIGWAVFGGALHKIGYSPLEILASTAWLVAVCHIANRVFAWFMKVTPNKESDLITALILTLILTPPKSAKEFVFVAVAGSVAMATKYGLALYKSHVFNPAAAGAFFVSKVCGYIPSWWIGTKFMTPLIIIGGILILRKMKRFHMMLAFLALFIVFLVLQQHGTISLSSANHVVWLSLLSTPVFFFATIMLTEPLTSPAMPNRALIYALIVSGFYSINRLGVAPEGALLIGNIATLAIAYQRRYELGFIGKKDDARGITSYAFAKPKGFKYKPGQYMEWTLDTRKTDSRGNRRYLSLSSAPSEDYLMFTVKQPPQNPSLFKQRLATLTNNEQVTAGRLSGVFTLPKKPDVMLAFIAGGVGITPFRSMIKQLVDNCQKRDIELLYSAASKEEFAFTPLFLRAAQNGLKANYVIGSVTSDHLAKITNYKSRHFYVSGPYSLVQAVESELLKLHVPASHIHTDYFPGYGA